MKSFKAKEQQLRKIYTPNNKSIKCDSECNSDDNQNKKRSLTQAKLAQKKRSMHSLDQLNQKANKKKETKKRMLVTTTPNNLYKSLDVKKQQAQQNNEHSDRSSVLSDRSQDLLNDVESEVFYQKNNNNNNNNQNIEAIQGSCCTQQLPIAKPQTQKSKLEQDKLSISQQLNHIQKREIISQNINQFQHNSLNANNNCQQQAKKYRMNLQAQPMILENKTIQQQQQIKEILSVNSNTNANLNNQTSPQSIQTPQFQVQGQNIQKIANVIQLQKGLSIQVQEVEPEHFLNLNMNTFNMRTPNTHSASFLQNHSTNATLAESEVNMLSHRMNTMNNSFGNLTLLLMSDSKMGSQNEDSSAIHNQTNVMRNLNLTLNLQAQSSNNYANSAGKNRLNGMQQSFNNNFQQHDFTGIGQCSQTSRADYFADPNSKLQQQYFNYNPNPNNNNAAQRLAFPSFNHQQSMLDSSNQQQSYMLHHPQLSVRNSNSILVYNQQQSTQQFQTPISQRDHEFYLMGLQQGQQYNKSIQQQQQHKSTNAGLNQSLNQGRKSRKRQCQVGKNQEFMFTIQKENILADHRTTIMIANIPLKYTAQQLMAHFNQQFMGQYDFFYLPIDFERRLNLGFAFINFTNVQDIVPFYEEFNNRKWDRFNIYKSDKVCKLKYARIQGLQSLDQHFENSCVIKNIDNERRPQFIRSRMQEIINQQKHQQQEPNQNQKSI